MKNILCINTVGKGTQMVLKKDRPVCSFNAPFSKHSETLFPKLEQFLKVSRIKLSDVECFGVVIGPGSFTGIRIGLSVVNAFSFVNKTPIVAVSAFEVLAWEAKIKQKADKQICVVMDAGSDQVYYQLFEFKGKKLKALCVPTVETIKHFQEFEKRLKDVFVCSDSKLDLGMIVYALEFEPKALLKAVLQHVDENDFVKGQPQPLYLRLSQGEICQVKLDKLDFLVAGASEKMALLGVDVQNSFDYAWNETTWQNKLKSTNFVCKQAISSGTLVGIIAYSNLNKDVTLEKIVVTKPAKGQGVAKFMLEKVLNELKLAGFKSVKTQIKKDDIAMSNLLLSFGFKQQKLNNDCFEFKKVL